MSVMKALQTWYDYGVLLQQASRLRFLDGEKLEGAIRAHKKCLAMIEQIWGEESQEE